MQGKARLGSVVHKKTSTVLAFTHVNKEDEPALAKLVESVKTNYNDRFEEIRKHWGGGVMSQRTQHHVASLEKAKAKEIAARNA